MSRRTMPTIWIACFSLVGFVSSGIICHAQAPVVDKKPLPSQESFKEADGIVAFGFIHTNRTWKQCSDNDLIQIYNEDGSVWYEFGWCEPNSLFYGRNPKIGFKPYAAYPQPRVKAISKNWYQVVVNEETQATKYMPVDNPATACVPMEKFVMNYGYVTFDKENNPLRDKPDGKRRNVSIQDDEYFFPRRIEGEWLFVVNNRGDGHQGWIRWKKERTILIGFILNHHKFANESPN